MTVNIYELIYDPGKGRDVAHAMEVDYDPGQYKTQEAAAKGLYEALKKFAVEKYGFSKELAEGEIMLFDPERAMQYSGTRQWVVVWESGPYQWAVGMSMEISGPWGYCEPYYSFDLCFTD